MKQTLLIALFTALSLSVKAHDYFFAFAEMEYNPFTEQLELTVVATTHDFELALEESGNEIENMKTLNADDIAVIEAYMNKHFTVSNGDSTCHFKFIGHEISMTGTTDFYFESSPIHIENQLDMEFDLLMETFEEQQNKVTFYYEDQTLIAAFTQMKQTQTIHIPNNEE